jgi:uncharacterized protein (TIGR01777 family)
MLSSSKVIPTLPNKIKSASAVWIHPKERKIHPVNMEMTKEPRRVVLSGASGLLGGALLRALVARGEQPVQLVRRFPVVRPSGDGEPGTPLLLAWNPAAEFPVADPTPLEGLTAAVHFSGANISGRRWTRAYRREMTESRLVTTAALVRALSRLRRPPEVLLAASAIGFYGDRGEEMLDERTPAGDGFFPELCQQWEAAARPATESGIRVVHLRLGVVLSSKGGALAKMIPLFRLGLGGQLGNGRQWMSWISLDDAVRAMLFAIDTPTLQGPVNLTAPNPVTNRDFTRTLARQLKRPAVAPVPAFALRLALGQMADEALLASARVFPGKLLTAGFRFQYPVLEQAMEAALRPA